MTRRSEDTRRFIAAVIGGQLGAFFGLLFFGGLLFAPLLIALAGSAAGPLVLLGRDRVRQKAGERYVRTAIRS